MKITLPIILFVTISLHLVNGDAYAWGRNNMGQLGLGITRTPQNFTKVPTYNGKNIERVSWSGLYHFATMSNGDVYVTGANGDRQLGLFTGNVPGATSTPLLNPALRGFSSLHAGFRQAAGLAENGTAFGWGYCGSYTQGAPSKEFYTPVPTNPAYELDGKVVDLALNIFAIFIVANNGTVSTAGGGDQGKLGIGGSNPNTRMPLAQMTFWKENKVALKKILTTNTRHSCAFATNQSIYCWGANEAGEQGVNDTENNWSPERVSFFDTNGYYVAQLALGENFTAALTCGGKVFAWGSNKFGQLGNGAADANPHPLPEEVTQLSDKNIVELVAYNSGLYARSANDDWYVWGAGLDMAHGMGHHLDILVPTLNPRLKNLNINKVASSGNSHSFLGWYDPNAPTTRVGCPLQINECQGSHKCASSATCVDTERSYKCVCPEGLAGDGILVSEGGVGCRTPCADIGKIKLLNGTCVSCKVGTVANEFESACVPCSVGSYNAPGSTTCTQCVGMTYTYSPKGPCSKCQPSMVPTLDHSACTKCPPGTHRLDSESSCSRCPAGTARCGTAGVCKPCTTGYFADEPGMANCQICPPGSIASAAGSTACTECRAGTYMAYSGRSSCVACPPGTTSPAGSPTKHYCM